MACVLITDIVRAANDAHHDWKHPDRPEYTRKMSKPRAWWSHSIVYEPVYKLTTRIERKVNPERLAPYTMPLLDAPSEASASSTALSSPDEAESPKQSSSLFSRCSSRRSRCSRHGGSQSCSPFASVPPAHAVDTYRRTPRTQSPVDMSFTPTPSSSTHGCSDLELELCGMSQALSLRGDPAASKDAQDPPPPYPGPPRRGVMLDSERRYRSRMAPSPTSALYATNPDVEPPAVSPTTTANSLYRTITA